MDNFLIQGVMILLNELIDKELLFVVEMIHLTFFVDTI
jgi:hypothetical protein